MRRPPPRPGPAAAGSAGSPPVYADKFIVGVHDRHIIDDRIQESLRSGTVQQALAARTKAEEKPACTHDCETASRISHYLRCRGFVRRRRQRPASHQRTAKPLGRTFDSNVQYVGQRENQRERNSKPEGLIGWS